MMMPYLSFKGDCEDAFLLYAEVFGGHVEYASRYTEATGGAEMAGKVMHSEVSLGSYGHLSGGDYLSAAQNDNAIQLLIHCPTAAEAERICDGLQRGGVHLQKLTPHPPPDDGGMGALVRDRFGFQWIVTAPNGKKE